jgi:PAS domain S-box-containing protein
LALQAVLEPLGHRLVRAASGREAIERTRIEDFAVILLDVNMPIMDGFQTAEQLREQPRTRATPIIFVSAVERDPAEIRKGYRYGAVDFLVKPLVQEILRSKVSVFVELFLQSEQLKQRKAAEEKLRETQARLNLALEAGRLGAWEWSLLTNRFSFSPMLEQLHGIPPGSFGGTFAAFQSDIHPEDRERVLQAIRESVQERREYHLEYRIVRPDGQLRWLETHGQLVIDPAGLPLRLVGVCQDVTERRQAEESARRLAIEEGARKAAEAAKEREASLAALRIEVSTALGQGGELRQMLGGCCEALLKHLGVAFARLWTLNPETQMLELQASVGTYTHIDGGHARVPVGKYKIGRIAKECQPHLTNDLLNDPLLGDREWAAANKFSAFAGYPLLVDGHCIGVVALFARHELSASTLSAVSLVADAIAQGILRKHTELALEERARELARSNEELERFAYVASHDLQEPLRMVASYTQLLGRRYKGKLDSDADEFIAFAVDGVTRMQALINDLLTFSRVGTQGGALAPMELGKALAAAEFNLRAAIESTGAVITSDALPTVLANERQMVQLLQNLVGNAIKFHGEKPPRIHVSAERHEGEWQIAVADNGIGIDPTFFNRLFIVFARLHNRSEYAGNGIGLAICKKIIERHGGHIWLKSQPGHGSTFLFTLHGVKS